MNGLELASMNFRDDVYATKKYVDRQRIMEQLGGVREMRLRSGLEILLSESPQEREKIYGFWGIDFGQEYQLSFLESLEKERKIKGQMNPNEQFRKPITNYSTDSKNCTIEALNLGNVGRNTYKAASSGRKTSNT